MKRKGNPQPKTTLQLSCAMSVVSITVSRPMQQSYNEIARNLFGPRDELPSKLQHDGAPEAPETDSENQECLAMGSQPQDHEATVLLSEAQNDQPPPELVERAKKRNPPRRPVKCDEPGCGKWFLDSHRVMEHKRTNHPESLT